MSGVEEQNHDLRVASHYDDLDGVYRRIWGEGLHHGLWDGAVETTAEAADRMTEFVGKRLNLCAGDRLLDVGCGSGRMAADLAGEFAVKSRGITISQKQWEQAVPGVDVAWGGWLENEEPDGLYDAVMAVESLEHMQDPRRALDEMGRVVRPGGRVVLCCWMTCEKPRDWERRFLIDPIRRDGMLGGMAGEPVVREWLESAGLELLKADDLSRQVERTWPDCLWRSVRMVLSDREMRGLIRDDFRRSLRMGFTLVRIWIAYVLGALRYVVFTARRRI